MTAKIQYHGDSYLPRRIFDNGKLAFTKDTGYEYKKNGFELIGNFFLIPIDHLPRLRHAFKNPSIITVALTTAALVGNSFLFYPGKTTFYGKRALSFIKDLPKEKIKFAAYIATMVTIAGFGLRALGRFQNADVTDQFWYSDGSADPANERSWVNPKRWVGSASTPKTHERA